MADQKISQLTSISTPADADEVPIVDDSASQTKKISASDLRSNYMVKGVLAVSTITSDKKLATSDNNGWIICDTDSAGSDITITVPGTLATGIVVHVRKSGTGGNVVFSGTGTMSNLAGKTTVSAEDGIAALVVESSTTSAITERS